MVLNSLSLYDPDDNLSSTKSSPGNTESGFRFTDAEVIDAAFELVNPGAITITERVRAAFHSN